MEKIFGGKIISKGHMHFFRDEPDFSMHGSSTWWYEHCMHCIDPLGVKLRNELVNPPRHLCMHEIVVWPTRNLSMHKNLDHPLFFICGHSPELMGLTGFMHAKWSAGHAMHSPWKKSWGHIFLVRTVNKRLRKNLSSSYFWLFEFEGLPWTTS